MNAIKTVLKMLKNDNNTKKLNKTFGTNRVIRCF